MLRSAFWIPLLYEYISHSQWCRSHVDTRAGRVPGELSDEVPGPLLKVESIFGDMLESIIRYVQDLRGYYRITAGRFPRDFGEADRRVKEHQAARDRLQEHLQAVKDWANATSDQFYGYYWQRYEGSRDTGVFKNLKKVAPSRKYSASAANLYLTQAIVLRMLERGRGHRTTPQIYPQDVDKLINGLINETYVQTRDKAAPLTHASL